MIAHRSVDKRRDWSNLSELAPGLANGSHRGKHTEEFSVRPRIFRRPTLPEDTAIIDICMLHKSGFSPVRGTISAATMSPLAQIPTVIYSKDGQYFPGMDE
jgi:hypothetical protein